MLLVTHIHKEETLSKQSKQSEPTSWKRIIESALGVGIVAGIVGIFSIWWGVGVLVFLSLFFLSTVVKPFVKRLAAIAMALVVAVIVSNVIPALFRMAYPQ